MRTKNALNKPKFCQIKLSELNKVLREDAEVMVSIKWAESLFPNKYNIIESNIQSADNTESENIEFTVNEV